VHTALARLPADRFATAHDFAAALERPSRAPRMAESGAPEVERVRAPLSGSELAISADGQVVVFRAGGKLFARRMNALDTVPTGEDRIGSGATRGAGGPQLVRGVEGADAAVTGS
jgi:hypothetical protein